MANRKNAEKSTTIVAASVPPTVPVVTDEMKAAALRSALAKLPKPGESSMIDPRAIRVMPGFNVRRFDPANDAADASLMASIAGMGTIENPLTVRIVDGVCFVVSGHRRLAAIMQLIANGAEFKRIPVVAEREGRTDIDRTASLWTSNDGKPLSGLERGLIVVRMRDYGWTTEEIAEKFGISIRYVGELLAGQRATKALKALVQDGKMSFTAAVEIAKQVKDTLTQEALTAAINKRLKEEAKAKASTSDVQKSAKDVGVTLKQAKPSKEAKAEAAAEAKAEAAAAKEAAKGAPKGAAKAGNPATAPSTLAGPFTSLHDAVRDASGLEIATAATRGIAAEMARLLTLAVASVGTVPGSEPEPAKAEAAAEPAKPEAAAEPAKGAAKPPAKMAAHGRKPVKPAAEPAIAAKPPAKAGRKPANA